jgi:hypothetical protein
VRRIIRAIDRILRRLSGVFEFADRPDCIFRVSIGRARYPLSVPGGRIPAGAKVLELHFWNEHMPPMPGGRAALGPAVRLRRMVASSTHLLAEAMKTDPRLAGVEAVGGVTPLFRPGDRSPAEGIFLRLGFCATPHKNPLGRCLESWEELYAWLLLRAFTFGEQNRRSLRGLRRSDFWMSADQFLRLYGGTASRPAADGPGRTKAAEWWRRS